MSVSRNFGRTLSGQTDLSLDNIRLPNNVNTIKIDGNSGLPNQVLAKNGITNKLEWDFVETTTIPDGSITGNKLAPNIVINTSGNITGAIITATDKFVQSGTNDNLYNGKIRTPAITTLNSDNGLTTLNGGNVELFSDGGTTKKIELNGGLGDIKTFNASGNETIDIDGATGNINMKLGGHIELFDGAGNIAIELNGSNGLIECRDLNVLSHSGTIAFDVLRANQIALPKTGTATTLITDTQMNLGQTNISAEGTYAKFKNGLFNGGLNLGSDSLVIRGQTETLTDASGNLGTIKMDTGNLNCLTGNITATIGNITATAGDITATNGNVYGSVLEFGSSIQHGSTLPSSFTIDSTGDIDTPNGNYTSLNGNITLTNGTFFGNVDGTITETHIDGQSLNISNLGSGGATGIVVEDGYDIDLYSDSAITKTINLDSSTGNITMIGNVDCRSIESLTGDLLGQSAGSTTTIGNTGGNQTFESLTALTLLGSTTASTSNITTIRGGTINLNTLTNGITNVDGELNMLSNDLNIKSVNLIAGTGLKTSNINWYNNELKYFNLDGRNTTQSLFHNATSSIISENTGTQVLHAIPDTNIDLTKTNWLGLDGFGLFNIIAVSTTYRFRISFMLDFLNTTTSLVYCRVDTTSYNGGNGLASSISSVATTSNQIDQRHIIDCVATNLVVGNVYDFYPRWGKTSSGGKASITHGASFGPICFDCNPSNSVWSPPVASGNKSSGNKSKK
tara:strand:- start:6563 stop:8773 length:2211 start_codon:yes stop_codon:yes gene_type:complete